MGELNEPEYGRSQDDATESASDVAGEGVEKCADCATWFAVTDMRLDADGNWLCGCEEKRLAGFDRDGFFRNAEPV